ncbi:uncharacterized protein LOC119973538 isoform X2 [Scyliorhinus canicula]|uniref:uncharacterized protein LOC119973538 isoform X2 n=1 Tax=Scyliorhinus canicula TaxID=7830 RepID=UPI0018F35FD3|nr:uncharacterized protein LOC119973538 isoform X2 [Scyliorhinus canicula]
MLGPNVYFRDLWNACISTKGSTVMSKEDASERAAQCASLVLKRCGGHPGSAELWSLLRENSEAKIARLDAQMSKAFKSVFSIYTRDLRIKQNAQPDSNCLSDDWEQDFQTLHQTQFQKCVSHMKNSLGLMNRASESNQDRASAIIANNPIPDINDLDGKDTPMRFLSNIPSKLRHPVKKQRVLPPLKHPRQHSAESSTILKQEEQVTLRERTLATKASKKESASNLLKKKEFKKVVKPAYPLSPKVFATKPSLKAWTPEMPERETNLQAMLWEPLQSHQSKKCEHTVSGKSKECNLEDTGVISISQGLDTCRRSS